MKQILIASLAGLLVGAALAKYYWPTMQTKVEVQEKEVTRTDVRTVVRTITKPDGTTESVTETVDKSVQQINKQTTLQVASKPQWALGLSAGTQLREFGLVYGASVQRRILGPVFAGAYGRTDGEFGLSVGLEF